MVITITYEMYTMSTERTTLPQLLRKTSKITSSINYFLPTGEKKIVFHLGLREIPLRNGHFHKHFVQMMDTHAIRGVLSGQDSVKSVFN